MLVFFGIAAYAAAPPVPTPLKAKDDQVQTWNDFSAALYTLHQRQVAAHPVRQTKETGQYGGEFARRFSYTEISYHDTASGKLLGRVRHDRDKPEILHEVEVYLYDEVGRLVRDYAFIYLPWARNAPIRTFINLHRYHGELHGYRQFDASGNRIYEYCRGRLAGQEVDISLNEEDIGPKVQTSEAYRACFAGLSNSAGIYLTPQ
jgi:hypothetical protein